MNKMILTLAALLFFFSVEVIASTPDSSRLSSGSSKGSGSAHWEYKGNLGPDQWGDLSDSYELCKTGKNQSPIDIKKGSIANLDNIEFHYQEFPLTVVNNGHTVQVNTGPGAYIKVGKERYELLQYHFHSPSEHQVQGIPYSLEMHLVHKSKKGNLAVVGVLLKEGKHNGELKKIWDLMPTEVTTITSPDISLNPIKLLPDNRSYFYYSGSLTTPPCSENVKWFVLTNSIEAARSQALAFLNIIHHPNARPTQKLNRRFVFVQNN